MLEEAGACGKARADFLRLYGEGGVITYDQLMRGAQVFDWIFAADNLLTPRQKAHFRNLVLNRFRAISRVNDRDGSKRRAALAHCFYEAYFSPE